MGEGDVEEEWIIGVIVDEFERVVGDELGQALMLERLGDHGGSVVKEARLRAREFFVKLLLETKCNFPSVNPITNPRKDHCVRPTVLYKFSSYIMSL